MAVSLTKIRALPYVKTIHYYTYYMSDLDEQRSSDTAEHLRIDTKIKVNAWLRVLPRSGGRELHELESLFLSIATGDRLNLDAFPSTSAEFHLTSNRPDLLPRNSVQQAWLAFTTPFSRLPCVVPFNFRISGKHIPEKTGLGAGSGDAGAAR